MLERLRHRIQEKSADMHARPVTIAALGDSVTAGVFERVDYDFAAVYHARLKRLLEARWPQCIFNVLNVGVNGDSAPGGLARLERDVVPHQPDLVIIAFGLNDSGGGEAGRGRFADALRGIARALRERTEAELLFLTPSFMNSRDAGDAVAPNHRAANLPALFAERQNSGLLAHYAGEVRAVAAEFGCPVADVYRAWEKLAQAGADTTAMLANGLNHPDREAHRIPAELIMQCIDATGAQE
ncbi:MAG: GDSL-type esterase/lipase family protein [Lentisphaeria bacterium]|jgi:lysophospholipase L1-like esterase|nr:GDSL-type esterase/lipase family protein [Lentisphaeria bacterium]